MKKLNKREVLFGSAALGGLLLGTGPSFAVDLTGLNDPPAFGEMTLGPDTAKVTVIEYASPTCPVCANFMINFYPKLKSDYIDTGKIFYVYRVFLRGPDDAVAEKLARCMPKDKYLSFHDMLFRNQSKWDYEFGIPSPDGVHAALVQLAGEAGMSAAEADRCIASTKDEDAISKVGEDGVAQYQVNATPTFVVNGQAEAGWEHLNERIERALTGK